MSLFRRKKILIFNKVLGIPLFLKCFVWMFFFVESWKPVVLQELRDCSAMSGKKTEKRKNGKKTCYGVQLY